MSSGFVKLYSSILDSSVWSESAATRLVWITVLAMADADGYVSASLGGLARRAQVSREECEAALEVLMGPDPDDRSGVDEGRRLKSVQGGWQIVNHRHYREMQSASQVKTAERVRRWKERNSTASPQKSVSGNAGNARVTVGNAGNAGNAPEANAEAKAEAEDQNTHNARAMGKPADPILDTFTTASDELPDDWKPNADHVALCGRLGLNLEDEVGIYRARRKRDRFRCGNWDADFEGWLRQGKKLSRENEKRRGAGTATAGGPSADWPTDRDISLRERIRSGEFGEALRAELSAGKLDASLARRRIAELEQRAKERSENVPNRNLAQLTANIGRPPQ